MRPSPKPAPWRRWLSPLVAVPILAMLTLGAWALSSPVGSSPDEDFHLASIWCGAGAKQGACATTDNPATGVVPRDLMVNAVCYAFDPTKSAACQLPGFGTTPSDTVVTGRGNFTGLYPAVYYAVASVFVGPNVDMSVLAIRFANALIFVGSATALFFLLPRARRATLVGGLVITAVPLGMFLVPSVNPSSWAITSAGILWMALLGYFETTGWRRIGLGALALLSTLIGAGARADAAVYAVVAIVVVLILTVRRDRNWLLQAILPLVLIIIAVVFWCTSGQMNAASAGLVPHANDPVDVQGLILTNLVNMPDLWVGAFGRWGLGWLDTTMPAVVWFASFGIFAAAITIGLGARYRRKPLAAAFVLVTLVVIPLILLVQTRVLVGSYVQPRYLLPLIVVLAGILLLQPIIGQLRVSRSQSVVAVVALALANSVALHTNIRRYVTGIDVGGVNLDARVEWWWNMPLSPMAVWVGGSVSFAAMLVIISSQFWRRRAALLALAPVPIGLP